MDYGLLKQEVLSDPEGIGYAGKSPEQIAALLASTTVQVECYVSLKDLQSDLMETVVPPAPFPVWWMLQDAANSNKLAAMAFDLFNSRLDNLNTRGAFQAAALNQLQQAGLIDAALRAKIDAKATKTISRGLHLCGAEVSVLDVQFALMSA